VVDQHENFQKAIRVRKARNIVIDSILSRPTAPGVRVSRSSRQNLAAERIHNDELIADLEAQDAKLLLRKAPRTKNGSQSHSLPDFAGKPETRESLALGSSTDRARQNIQLGRWAAKYLEELKKINGFALGRDATELSIRESFPKLDVWREVVDRLYPKLKDNFFGEISRRRWRHRELFDLMANAREISGLTLYGFYKAYRAADGLGRKHLPPNPRTSKTKDDVTPKNSLKNSQKHSQKRS